MNSEVIQWALRNNVNARALSELRAIFNTDGESRPPVISPGLSEAYVQSLVRLEAAQKGLKLWRNNVGVLKNENGIPVRYGLGNDSPELNKRIKSGDLIGWRPILIQPFHVGSTVAQFVSRECKRPGWHYSGNEHEQAQLKWAEVITAAGGDAGFCTGEGTL
jgi:hypothetical protein